MEIGEYHSVRNWFQHRKKPYAKQTKGQYLEWMELFCNILNNTPDQIVNIVKESERPIDAMENMEKSLAIALENKGRKARTIHQRLNALHSFWRANGIPLTPQIMKQIQSNISKTIKRLAARNP